MKHPAALFDMDGTLVDISEFRHLAYGPAPDYDKFHDFATRADPIDWVVDKLRGHQTLGHKILVATARSERFKTGTVRWLQEQKIRFDVLWMRFRDDIRPDHFVKLEMLQEAAKDYDITHAYEDNMEVARLWLAHQIPTTVVPGGLI